MTSLEVEKYPAPTRRPCDGPRNVGDRGSRLSLSKRETGIFGYLFFYKQNPFRAIGGYRTKSVDKNRHTH